MVYTILLLIFVLFLFYVFLLYPIILFFQCLFDSTVGAFKKLLLFILSFILFPLPSYVYGAFGRKSWLSRILLGLYALIFVMAVIAVIAGSLTGGSRIIQTAVTNYGGVLSDKLGIDLEDVIDVKIKEPEPEFQGRNTYTKEDVQVFESGRNARDFGAPPQPTPIDNAVTAPPPSSPLHAACLEASSNPKLSQESCNCVRDGFGNNEVLQTLLADKNDSEKVAIENQAVQIYGSIANQDAAAIQSIKAQIQTNPVMKDAVLVVMTLTRSCAPPPVDVESPLVPLPVAPE